MYYYEYKYGLAGGVKISELHILNLYFGVIQYGYLFSACWYTVHWTKIYRFISLPLYI
jgi:hypothetical protein